MSNVRGMLEATELERLIADDEIDTVLVVFPDHQGRLVGKRVTGHFFRDHVLAGRDRGVQLPPRGRRRHDACSPATSSPTGTRATATSCAGPTSRRCARSRGSRRPRSCSATSSTSTTVRPVEVSPRRILQRQLERAADRRLHGQVRLRARVLPVPRLLRGGAGEGVRRPRVPRLVHRGLPHPPDDA